MHAVICDTDKKYIDNIRALLNKIIDKSKLCLYSSTKSSECIKIFEQYDIDLLILDVYIDDMNGIELARYLRKKYEKSFKILYVASKNTFAAESYEVNAIGFLLKPINERKFIELLTKHRLK